MLLEHTRALVPPPAFALPDGAHEAGRKHELVLDVNAPVRRSRSRLALARSFPFAFAASLSLSFTRVLSLSLSLSLFLSLSVSLPLPLPLSLSRARVRERASRAFSSRALSSSCSRFIATELVERLSVLTASS